MRCMDTTERTRRNDHVGYERITPALLLDVFDDRARRLPPGLPTLPTLPTLRMPERGGACECRKLHPHRSSGTSALVDDSAEPVSPTYHKMVELGGFMNLRQSSQGRR